MKRLFPSFTLTLLAAALFALGAPSQANAAQQALNPIDDSDRLVNFGETTDLAAVNAEVFIHDASQVTGIDRTGMLNVKSTTQVIGAFSPRARPGLASNGIKEEKSDWSVSLTFTEPEYYVADTTRSPDYRQRADARCPRPQAVIT